MKYKRIGRTVFLKNLKKALEDLYDKGYYAPHPDDIFGEIPSIHTLLRNEKRKKKCVKNVLEFMKG